MGGCATRGDLDRPDHLSHLGYLRPRSPPLPPAQPGGAPVDAAPGSGSPTAAVGDVTDVHWARNAGISSPSEVRPISWRVVINGLNAGSAELACAASGRAASSCWVALATSRRDVVLASCSALV